MRKSGAAQCDGGGDGRRGQVDETLGSGPPVVILKCSTVTIKAIIAKVDEANQSPTYGNLADYPA